MLLKTETDIIFHKNNLTKAFKYETYNKRE